MTSNLDTCSTPRSIDIVLFENVNMLDVTGPAQAFDTARVNGRKSYALRYLSLDGKPVRAGCGLQLVPDARVSPGTLAEDILIPGGAGVDALIADGALLSILASHLEHTPNGRILSICSGALVLAAAGVLDGRPATTHWSRASDTQRYPQVLWDLDQIYCANGRVYTSAGVTTGIDLALSIIRADCGPSAALDVARELVVQLRRTGGQSQFAMHLASQFAPHSALAQLIEQIVSAPHLDWSLAAIAQTAGLTPRTLTRHFKRDLGQTPVQFVEHVRVDHARGLIEDGFAFKQVAVACGFADVQRMRRAFQRRLGTHVSDYAKGFGQ